MSRSYVTLNNTPLEWFFSSLKLVGYGYINCRPLGLWADIFITRDWVTL